MCGRYAQSLNTSELAEEFGIGAQTPAEELPSSWNIAPTNPIYIVRAFRNVGFSWIDSERALIACDCEARASASL